MIELSVYIGAVLAGWLVAEVSDVLEQRAIRKQCEHVAQMQADHDAGMKQYWENRNGRA